MTKKQRLGNSDKKIGLGRATAGESRYLSPQGPYTGDGKTKRSIFDKVRVTFRKPDGSK